MNFHRRSVIEHQDHCVGRDHQKHEGIEDVVVGEDDLNLDDAGFHTLGPLRRRFKEIYRRKII